MSNDLTPFESLLKQKMASYEAPYNIKNWYHLDKKMNNNIAGNAPWVVAAVATFVVSAAIGIGLFNYRYSASVALSLDNSSPRFENLTAANIKSRAKLVQEPIQLIEPNSDFTAMIAGKQGDENAKYDSNGLSDLSSDNIDSGATNQNSAIETNSAKPEFGFQSNIRQGCAGEEIDFVAHNGPNSGSYLWNFGDGRFSKEANPKHKFSKPGKYDVSLSVTSNDGQISTAVLNDMITIHPTPDANFQWNFINESPNAVEVQIINTSYHANQYEWKFEDGSGSSQATPIKAIENDGKYSVLLKVSNDYGCQDEIIKQIAINAGSTLGAARSSKLGEVSFMPSALKSKEVNFELAIYDVNGQRVFETKSYQKPWDGKLANGEMADSGVYKWKVIITEKQAEQKYFYGDFTVFP